MRNADAAGRHDDECAVHVDSDHSCTCGAYEPPEPDPAHAYSAYTITTHGEGQPCHVTFATNDDGDTGYPGEYATDAWDVTGPDALEIAKRHTGKSRQGVGHRVYVTIDGEVY